jgi:hypothetical protein
MVNTSGAVSVSEDESAHGGFALIDLGRKVSRSSITLSFRRLNAEPRHLGQDGWQPEVCWLEPDRIDQSGTTTIIRIGPGVVNQISELDPIEISIRGERDAFPIVHWPALTPSPTGVPTGVGICLPEQKGGPVIELDRREQTGNDSLVEAPADMREADAFDEKREPPAVAPATHVAPPVGPSSAGGHRSSKRGKLAVGVAMVMVSLFAGVFLVNHRNPGSRDKKDDGHGHSTPSPPREPSPPT